MKTVRCTKRELEYLKSRDRRLGEAIDRIGPVRREMHHDLFSGVVRNIAAQQVSGRAAEAVWRRLCSASGGVEPRNVAAAAPETLRSCGLSAKKVEYIKDFAAKTVSGEFDIASLASKSDEEAIAMLTSLKGIGVWTAEMLLLFSLGRPDVLSFGDFGIQRGMRMLYRHRKITKALFGKYRRRLSPCGSVASLYFWAIAGGALPELSDPAAHR